jgi:MauM/NapG family ferredoxin protein
LVFLVLLTRKTDRKQRRTIEGRLYFAMRIVALVVLAGFFMWLDKCVWTGLYQDKVPSVQVFFWSDPLLLVVTWLSAHALPVAIYALPAIIGLGVAVALLRRWVSMHAVLTLTLLVIVGVIAVVAWREAHPVANAKEVLVPGAAAWVPLPSTLLWALGTVLVTLVLGRVFCGWFCPLGTVHAIASRLLSSTGFQPGKREKRLEASSTARWQRAKYYVLVGLLVMALFGGHWGTLFDPLVLLYRTAATAVFPAAQWMTETGSKAILDAEPQEEPEATQEDVVEGEPATPPPKPKPTLRLRASEKSYEFLRDHVFYPSQHAFLGSGLIFAFFLLTLALNAWRPRFWCRYLCPLGGLLGLLSWRPLLRRSVEKADCNGCGLCGTNCHGAASEKPGEGFQAAECLGCFNCADSCPRGALRFHWGLPLKGDPSAAPVDLSKRAVLTGAVGGVAALALLRITPQARGNTFHPRLIRPPGAREEGEFLKRCTACGLCMKVCPSGGLQPCWTEAGLEGLWTPRLVPQIGPCKQECPTLCGQVCPTGAIQPLSVEEKAQTKIGLAAFDVTRCIPYAYGRPCMVCEEHCPVATKAIYYVEVEVELHEDENYQKQKRTVQQPRVDVSLCTGCGECEKACVFHDRPAVRVFSAGESRNPGNQPALGDVGPYG